MNRYLLTSALLAAVAFTACGTASPVGQPDPATTQAGLVTFPSCQALESYIKDTAVLQMRESLDGYGDWYYGAPMADGKNEAATGQSGTPDHSTTNTQVAGVDEADFVKTDGNRVFYLVDRRLFVLKSWPAAQTALASTTLVEGYPTEMFLSETDHKLVVFSRIPAWTYDPRIAHPADQGYAWHYWYWYSDATKVTVYDVATDTPVLQDEYFLGGGYASSRRIGSVVRLVLSAQLRWPELKWWLDSWDPNDEAKNAAALDQLKAENEARIRAQPLADWLPKATVSVGGQRVDVTSDCSRYHRPTVGAKLGLATLATFDLAHPGNLDVTSVLTQTGEIYANADALYLASPEWSWGWWRTNGTTMSRTWLHKFSLASPVSATYQGSGSVPGTILDQFSLDEHQGYLRVATNLTVWGPNFQNPVTENRLYVLGQQGGALVQVGATPPIAPGERIYSSRFFGDKGFIVTYKQIDPLFALDLANPAQPTVVGELHIPGFSTYIHLLDPTHLLTIGSDTVVDPSTGRETRNGVALQIFDVSEMTNPVLTAKTLVGTRNGYSEALWDHKAFNYFAKTGTLAIPFSDYVPSASDYWGSFVSQLQLFHVDAAGSLVKLGAVDHKDLFVQNQLHDWYWWYEPHIRRSVQIEGFVYSFSAAGVKVSPVASPAITTALVRLPAAPVTGP